MARLGPVASREGRGFHIQWSPTGSGKVGETLDEAVPAPELDTSTAWLERFNLLNLTADPSHNWF